MNAGMHRDDAERLASAVRAAGHRDVEVVPDAGFFAVQVVVNRPEVPDTYTLYDDSDWRWLRERIAQ
jgi:hypothetical protein